MVWWYVWSRITPLCGDTSRGVVLARFSHQRSAPGSHLRHPLHPLLAPHSVRTALRNHSSQWFKCSLSCFIQIGTYGILIKNTKSRVRHDCTWIVHAWQVTEKHQWCFAYVSCLCAAACALLLFTATISTLLRLYVSNLSHWWYLVLLSSVSVHNICSDLNVSNIDVWIGVPTCTPEMPRVRWNDGAPTEIGPVIVMETTRLERAINLNVHSSSHT